MSVPGWYDVMLDVEKQFPSSFHPESRLTTGQVEQLKKIESCAGSFADTLLFGLAAVGELLVRTAETGELTPELAQSTGWLVESVAMLSVRLYEQSNGANYKLSNVCHEEVSHEPVAD